MDILKKHIILASKSPRRKEILEKAGFDFTIMTKEIDENFPDDLAVENVAAYIAEMKAAAVEDYIKFGDVLLTADTVVIINDTIYGKPKDRADAIRILKLLSGKMHTVITGVCMKTKSQSKTISSRSDVLFHELSDEEIEYYVDHFNPYDKAGAYAIQEWIGLCKIKSIKGSYTNILGLPMDAVYEGLNAL